MGALLFLRREQLYQENCYSQKLRLCSLIQKSDSMQLLFDDYMEIASQ